MNAAVKYQMISKIINSKDDALLNQIRELLGIEEVDFWDELGVEDQRAIDEGLNQLNNNDSVSHHKVINELVTTTLKIEPFFDVFFHCV
ncbi:MAG: hypothetical protein AAFQ94_22280, partial [Bacteroidota bacterium]